jgi:hypothetical protein
MTHVNAQKHQVRRVVSTTRGDVLVVALAPEGIWLRERGRRTAFLLPYGDAYMRAVRLHVDHERRTKAAARTARRH